MTTQNSSKTSSGFIAGFFSGCLHPFQTTRLFGRGIFDVIHGLQLLIKTPRLWPWATIPFLISLLLFIVFGASAWHFLASDWIHQTFLDKGGWATWVGWIISIVLWLCVAVITYFLITPLTACIASPFNEILSERVESLCLGETNKSKEPFSIKSFLRGMAITTGASVKLMIITLGLQLIALCIFLVPVIGPWIASIASAMITIRYITLEFTSYAMDRRFYTYAQRRDFLKRNRARTIGLGTMAFIIMLIPFVNAIMIPASAISGTLIFCDDLKNTTETKP